MLPVVSSMANTTLSTAIAGLTATGSPTPRPLECPAARNHLVQQRTEGKYAGPCIHLLRLRLFRGHVRTVPRMAPSSVRGVSSRIVAVAACGWSSETSASLASPKSSTFTRPSGLAMMLAGLIYRGGRYRRRERGPMRRPSGWRTSTSPSGIPFFGISRSSAAPSTYSMAMKSTPSAWSMSFASAICLAMAALPPAHSATPAPAPRA